MAAGLLFLQVFLLHLCLLVFPPRAGQGAGRGVGWVGTVQTGEGVATALGAESGFGPIYKKPQIHNVELLKEKYCKVFPKSSSVTKGPRSLKAWNFTLRGTRENCGG